MSGFSVGQHCSRVNRIGALGSTGRSIDEHALLYCLQGCEVVSSSVSTASGVEGILLL
jgi:hypothetical protein